MAAFYGAPYKPWWKWPNRPNQVPALCVASLLSGKIEQSFRSIMFDSLWRDGKDISDPAVLEEALVRAGGGSDVVRQAAEPSVHQALTERTAEAYANGVFGTPSFVCNRELYFGADRLEVLAWKLSAA
jgi:2-hydroxychromene-2-carboxylate isomerase